MKQRLSLIFAMTTNRVIGKDGWLAWDLPDELAYFRRTTAGKPVIMGRRTYQSVNRPMPTASTWCSPGAPSPQRG